MSFFTELFKLIGNLAWPALLFWIAKNYDQDIKAIIKRLQKAKFTGGELEFEKEVERASLESAEEAIKKLNNITDLPKNKNDSKEESLISESRTIQADIDGDGREELIVSQLEGPYWCAIRIYRIETKSGTSFEDSQDRLSFILLDKITANFLESVEDIDGDGKAEIITIQDDRESGLPHSLGIREKVSYKWIAGKMTEISRVKMPPPPMTQAEMNQDATHRYKEAEEEMNEIYEKVFNLHKNHPDKLEAITATQESWLNYSKLQAEAIAMDFDGGSIKTLVYYSALLKSTKHRIEELRSLSTNLVSGESLIK